MVNATVDNEPIFEYFSSGPVYSGNNFSTGTEIGTPQGFTWSNNGLKFFRINIGSNDVYEYDASTAFDVTTLSYNGTTLSIGSQDVVGSGITWNNDGSKLFLVGQDTDSVYMYNVPTPYSLSTGSYSGDSFSIGTQNSTVADIKWNNDGSKLYTLDDSSNAIYEYDASTAFDVTTLSYNSVSYAFSDDDIFQAKGFDLSGDGTALFVTADNQESIIKYDLSTPFDISTLSYSGETYDVSGSSGPPDEFVWNDTGSKFFISNGDNIHEFDSVQYEIGKITTEVPSTEVWKGEVGGAAEFKINGVIADTPETLVISDGDILESTGVNGYFSGFRVK